MIYFVIHNYTVTKSMDYLKLKPISYKTDQNQTFLNKSRQNKHKTK